MTTVNMNTEREPKRDPDGECNMHQERNAFGLSAVNDLIGLADKGGGGQHRSNA